MAKYTLIHLSDLHIGNSEKELNNSNQIVKSIGTQNVSFSHRLEIF